MKSRAPPETEVAGMRSMVEREDAPNCLSPVRTNRETSDWFFCSEIRHRSACAINNNELYKNRSRSVRCSVRRDGMKEIVGHKIVTSAVQLYYKKKRRNTVMVQIILKRTNNGTRVGGPCACDRYSFLIL